MKLGVSSAAIDRMLAEAQRGAPDECCGILLGASEHIADALPARNVHPTPRTHFEIDPQALIDAYRAARSGGPEVVGFYHSHPGGAAEPSGVDQASAAGDGRVWAIVGETGVTFWRDEEAGFVPLSYVVEDR